jgi:hypothetical protein
MSQLNRTGLQALAATAGVLVLTSFGAAFAATGHAWHAPRLAASDAGARVADPSQDLTDDPSEHPSEDLGDVSNGPTQTTDPTESGSADTATDVDLHAFHGLCRAYVVGNKSERGHALASPPFLALASAAGGADQVVTYCADLFPAEATDAPTDGTTDGTTGDVTDPTAPWTHAAHPVHPTHPSGGHGKPTGHVAHGHASHSHSHGHGHSH